MKGTTMANTTEMIRLIRHAATRLGEEDHTHYFVELANMKVHGYDKLKVLGASQSLVAAMLLAQTTLRFVAACMEDEPDAPVRAETLALDAQAQTVEASR